MSKKGTFDISLSDAQATPVSPVKAGDFNFSAYEDYENSMLSRCGNFWTKPDDGVLVYRRMRVAEGFSYGCRDMKSSLEWQLGALQESMKYKADVPNFLEPWYGLGTAASAFGFDYLWNPGQAPAVNGKFNSTREAYEYPVNSIGETPVGRQTMAMIEYFMEKTSGRLPISYCDVQSPLNVAGNIIEINGFMMDFFMDTEAVSGVMDKLADLIIDFTREQNKLLGDSLVYPGHGFASARNWDGFGMSDDNIVMLSDDLYADLVIPSFEKCSLPFGGPVLHSCGDWANKIDAVKKIRDLKMVDAAFSRETDPDPNDPGEFIKGFQNTGIIVNARIVGDLETIERKVRELWKPGIKLIVVTYCQSPEEQEKAYDLIHSICR